MTNIAALRSVAAGDAFPRPKDLAESAEQFEALLIEQMLRLMRAAEGEGGMGGGADAAGASLMEYAEQEMSRVIAAGGGFGLAKLVRESLTPRSDKTPAAAGTRPSR